MQHNQRYRLLLFHALFSLVKTLRLHYPRCNVKCRQFDRTFRCVMLNAVNVASGREESLAAVYQTSSSFLWSHFGAFYRLFHICSTTYQNWVNWCISLYYLKGGVSKRIIREPLVEALGSRVRLYLCCWWRVSTADGRCHESTPPCLLCPSLAAWCSLWSEEPAAPRPQTSTPPHPRSESGPSHPSAGRRGEACKVKKTEEKLSEKRTKTVSKHWKNRTEKV